MRSGQGAQVRTAIRTHVEALAEAQSGVLTRAQCLGRWMTPDDFKRLLRSGRWQRVHHSVYAQHVGTLDRRTRVSAALLSCGEGAIASNGRSAPWTVGPRPPGIEVLDMAERGDADDAIAWVSKACQRRRTTGPRRDDVGRLSRLRSGPWLMHR